MIDLSDNEITKLEGFPLLKRLHTLFLNNNRINRIGTGQTINPSLSLSFVFFSLCEMYLLKLLGFEYVCVYIYIYNTRKQRIG